MQDTIITQNTERKPARLRLALGSALSGSLALMILATPGAASAADECGVAPLAGGTVVCTPAGNPYPTGITYVAPLGDLTIVLEDGVRVTTTAPANIGVLATGGNALTIGSNNASSIISTSGAGAHGVQFLNVGSPIAITLDRVITSGADAIGVVANSATGNIAVNTNSVTTTGAGIPGSGAMGIFAQTGGAGNVTINSGPVDTAGAEAIGIRAINGTGAILVNAGNVATAGVNAEGINVTSIGGTATVHTGNVTTLGANSEGVYATGATGVTVTSGGLISTAGLTSNGVDTRSITGPVALTLDRVTTSGADSIGVAANSTSGDVSVRSNSVTTTGAGTPTNGALGIRAETGGTGSITINSGSVSTTGAESDAIRAINNGTGATLVNSANVSTVGANAEGINVTSAGGSTTINAGNVTTLGANSDGVYAVAPLGVTIASNGLISTAGLTANGVDARSVTGPVVLTLDRVATSGADSIGVVANSTSGNVSIQSNSIATTGAGTLTNGSMGILAQTGGTGTITVTSNSVSTTGAEATGIRAINTGTGLVLINSGSVATLGANAEGINVTSAGTAQVNSVNISNAGANGGGIYANALNGVTVNSTGTISTTGINATGIDARSAAGPVTVTASNVYTTGTGAQAILVTAAGNATATLNGAVRTTGAAAHGLTVNSGANAVVNVRPDATFSIAQGDSIRINAAGTSTLNNAGVIGNNAGGYAVVATGGPITINNTGNLNSDILLTAGNDVVNNPGTFTVGTNPDFGAGVDTFNNLGLVTLMGGATAPVAPMFVGLEVFNNSGTVDLRNGRAGDTLTLPGTYAGQNGTLGLDVATGGLNTIADRLIVGGAATGTTAIALNQLAGFQPVFNSGTVLVNAGAGTSANAFNLAGGAFDAGFVRYELGYDAANNDFLLTAGPSDTAYRTINYAEGIRSLWLKSADAVSAQLRARRDSLWSLGGGDTAGRFWMQIHGSKETREGQRNFNAFGQSRLTNTGYDQDYFGGQIGLDVSGGSGERGGWAFGVTGGYLNSSISYAGTADRVKFDVINGGVYASYTSGNLFFNALGKYDHYWAKAGTPSVGFQQDFTGNMFGARAELGLRLGSDSFFIEPAASISWVKSDNDDLTPLGTNIVFDDEDGLRGRIGGRIGGLVDIGGPKMSVHLGLNYVHEFKGRDRVSFIGGGQTLTYTNDRLRDYGEATLGMTIAQNESVSGFLEANYIRSFSQTNGLRGIVGLGARAGVRFRF